MSSETRPAVGRTLAAVIAGVLTFVSLGAVAAPSAVAATTVSDSTALAAALSGCTDGDEVVLGAEVSSPSESATVACDATLDLNGFALGLNNIVIASGNKFTIKSGVVGGSLTVIAGTLNQAGIQTTGAELVIQSGTVNATGATNGAGIGGHFGGGGAGGTITINGTAVVTAKGGADAAGIGGAYFGVGGTTTISSSATVNATGGNRAAGVGGGYLGTGGTVAINGSATVTAQGGETAAGIGGGSDAGGGSVTISGSAEVTASGGGSGAGIGGGAAGAGGSVTVSGSPDVTATGGDFGAGIGGGDQGAGATVMISNTATVTATGRGDFGGAGIGGGYFGNGGSVTIGGTADVTAVATGNGNSRGSAVGAGGGASVFGSLTVTGTLRVPSGLFRIPDSAVGDEVTVSNGGLITGAVTGVDPTVGAQLSGAGQINNGGAITLATAKVTGGSPAVAVKDHHYAVSFDLNEGVGTAAPQTVFAQSFTLGDRTFPTDPTRDGFVFTGWNTAEDGTGATIEAGDELPGTSADGSPVAVALYAQWNEGSGIGTFKNLNDAVTACETPVTLGGNITRPLNQLTIDCDLTLDLNGNDLILRNIVVTPTFKLTVKSGVAGGSLTVVASAQQAGIQTTGAELVVESGTITATGGQNGAGIGGGNTGAGGTITINGNAQVTATGGGDGAGIGGGRSGAGGIATIGGFAEVAASGGIRGAGIGGGGFGGGGTVTLQGDAQVTATGGANAAGIGDGGLAAGGIVAIGGNAEVTATGGQNGAGIGGGGFGGAGGTVTVQGDAEVMATGGGDAAGIGGGYFQVPESVTIKGNAQVSAFGGANGAGIGGGRGSASDANAPPIEISGTPTVTATGGASGSGIGGGSRGAGAATTISGDATVTATGGALGAGIGGGSQGNGGAVTISGTATVTATGTTQGAGIGGGFFASGATVIISDDADVTASVNGEGQAQGSAVGVGDGHLVFGSLTVSGTLRVPKGLFKIPNSVEGAEVTVADGGLITGAVPGVSPTVGAEFRGDGQVNNGGTITLPTAKVTGGTPPVVVQDHHYAVSFDLNDGVGTADAQTVFAESFTAGERTFPGDPTRAGFTFVGWNTADDGTGDTIEADDVLPGASADGGPVAVVLYAQWAVGAGTFDALDDAVTPCATPVVLNADINAPTETLTIRCDFTLDLNGHDLVLKNIVIESNNTLTVNTGVIGGTLTVVADPDQAGIQTTGAALVVESGTVTATGSLGGAGIGGAPGGGGGAVTVGAAADVTVVAGGPEEIAGSAIGPGLSSNEFGSLTVAGTLRVPSGLFKIPDSAVGDEVTVAAGGVITGFVPGVLPVVGAQLSGAGQINNGGAITLLTAKVTGGSPAVAVKDHHYAVSFDLNGGTGAAGAQTVFAESFTLGGRTFPANPTKPGLVFRGWNTADNGTGATFVSGSILPGTSAAGGPLAVTLHAQFSKPRCSDGLDNDRNGQRDFPQDLGCSSAADDLEITPACGAGVPLLGTAAGNVLVGSPLANTITGFGGSDRLFGRGGVDCIFGDGGKDLVHGGSGNDVLHGGPGADVIKGGPGADLIRGGGGNDTMVGGAGNDWIVAAGFAKDTVNCGPGNDVAFVDRKDVVKNCERTILITKKRP